MDFGIVGCVVIGGTTNTGFGCGLSGDTEKLVLGFSVTGGGMSSAKIRTNFNKWKEHQSLKFKQNLSLQ